MIVTIILVCLHVLLTAFFLLYLAWSKGYDDALEDMRKMLHNKN